MNAEFSALCGALRTVLVGATLICFGTAAHAQLRPPSDSEPHPMVELLNARPLHFSHRGGRASWPENTLLAFEMSVAEAQTDVLELDVHLSADGAPVVIHDFTVDATTEGTGLVRDMDLAQLKALDAAYDFSPDGVSYPYRGQGVSIPTLEEVFALVSDPQGLGGHRPYVNIEIKTPEPALAEAVARLIEGFDLADRICVGSFYGSVGQHLRRRVPEACSYYPLEAGLCYAADVLAQPSLEACPDFDVLEVPDSLLDEQFGPLLLQEAARDGIPVVVWTVNSPQRMDKLLEMGVSGIMTDKPEELREVMNAAGYPPSPATGY